jgi:hypothetical protein
LSTVAAASIVPGWSWFMTATRIHILPFSPAGGLAYGRGHGQGSTAHDIKHEQVPNLSTGPAVFLVGGKGLEPLASCMSIISAQSKAVRYVRHSSPSRLFRSGAFAASRQIRRHCYSFATRFATVIRSAYLVRCHSHSLRLWAQASLLPLECFDSLQCRPPPLLPPARPARPCAENL